jgi:sulfatase modifying factor 1
MAIWKVGLPDRRSAALAVQLANVPRRYTRPRLFWLLVGTVTSIAGCGGNVIVQASNPSEDGSTDGTTRDSAVSSEDGSTDDETMRDAALEGPRQPDTSVEVASDGSDARPDVTALRKGAACSFDAACASGHCTDGVCCDTACGGGDATDCQACNLSGNLGTCSPSPSSTVCRPAASGVCDTAETCDGTSTTCPSDTGPTCPSGWNCVANACVKPVGPSCAGGLLCGAVSCCDWQPLPGGTFMQGRASSGPESDGCSTWAQHSCEPAEQPEFSSTVSKFSLDTYEVTVGRFRKFVAAYPGSKPAPGAGANPNIPSSGWDALWTTSLPADRAVLIANLSCSDVPTWTDSGVSNQTLPINCVDWYTAFAFCAWDGGRLPTESEWEYAASGGEERPLSWTTAAGAPDALHAIYNQGYSGPGAFHGIAPVGSVPLGVSKWGQQDLAGNLWEWTLDSDGTYPTTASTNYAHLTSSSYREVRGGSFDLDPGFLRGARRGVGLPTSQQRRVGFRCARSTP